MAQLNARTEALLRRLVRREASDGVRKLLERTRAEDLAAALEHLTWAEQKRLVRLIEDRDFAAEVIAQLDEDVARAVLMNADEEYMVDILDRMELDDATDVVEHLPADVRERVIHQLEEPDEAMKELLDWPSDTAGGLMNPDVFTMPQTSTCGASIAALQGREDLELIHYLYCVDQAGRLVGVTNLRALLTHPPHTPLVKVMSQDVIQVSPDTDQEEVARYVERYDLLAIPVVGDGGRVLGVVTVDDVLDVIREEAVEDMMLMAGMSESVGGGAAAQALKRAGWLMATTIGGILMAEIIGGFEETLAKVAVLAGFIPVIMGMGGNVGIQSATVAVRGLATGEIQFGGVLRFMSREGQVGILLGLLFACLLGLYGTTRFGVGIGLAVASSVALSIAAAATIGGSIPLALNRLGADPAIATGPFVTTSVDILAILIYFNISRLLLGL